jgi:hypothetical protein
MVFEDFNPVKPQNGMVLFFSQSFIELALYKGICPFSEPHPGSGHRQQQGRSKIGKIVLCDNK